MNPLSPLLAALLFAGSARAALPADAPTQPPPPPSAQQPSAPSSDFDFNLLAPAPVSQQPSPEDAARFAQRVAERRQMLTIHQAIGFVTLASLAATDVVGQLNLNDKYGGGGNTNHFEGLHMGLATATLGLFATVGILGLLAPTPYAKPLHFDTAFVHKMMMSLATAGMVTQVVLGIMMAAHQGDTAQRDFATAHQVVGYVTLAAMAGGATAFVF